MGNSNLKRNRAVSGGKAAVRTNRWYHLRKVEGYDETGREVLECGHSLRPRHDMIGEYTATRRRCPSCPKPAELCATCRGTGSVSGSTVPLRCTDCDRGYVLAKRPREGWLDALGKIVPPENFDAAMSLLAENGLDLSEGALVLRVVAREMEHDEPERAQRYLRSWLPPHGSEILLMMVLATLSQPPQISR